MSKLVFIKREREEERGGIEGREREREEGKGKEEEREKEGGGKERTSKIEKYQRQNEVNASSFFFHFFSIKIKEDNF